MKTTNWRWSRPDRIRVSSAALWVLTDIWTNICAGGLKTFFSNTMWTNWPLPLRQESRTRGKRMNGGWHDKLERKELPWKLRGKNGGNLSSFYSFSNLLLTGACVVVFGVNSDHGHHWDATIIAGACNYLLCAQAELKDTHAHKAQHRRLVFTLSVCHLKKCL